MDNRWLPDINAQQGSSSTAAAMWAWLLQFQQYQYATATTILVVLIPITVCLYLSFLRDTRQGPTPSFEGFSRSTRPAGAGQASGAWTIVESGGEVVEGGVSWLGERELRSLEAICDTLLPGFSSNLDETVRETIDVVRSNLFQGTKHTSSVARPTPTATPKGSSLSSSTAQERHAQDRHEDLPPALEGYIRHVVERCMEMIGRPASDIGVAGLLARAYEVNLPHEQRSGLQLVLWMLNTRLGAFLLTGRAVPLPAQSFTVRHALLRRWSRSRIGKLREAFQGVKRLSCALYFSAHPEAIAERKPPPLGAKITRPTAALHLLDDSNTKTPSRSSSAASMPGGASAVTAGLAQPLAVGTSSYAEILSRLPSTLSPSWSTEAAAVPLPVGAGAPALTSSIYSMSAAAAMKTNPNWREIRYDPQHHRLAREAEAEAVSGAAAAVAAYAKSSGLWSGAKGKVAQAARAARAVSSPTLRNSHHMHNPPSPANTPGSISMFANVTTTTTTTFTSNHPIIRPGFFSRSYSTNNIGHTNGNAASSSAFLGSGSTTVNCSSASRQSTAGAPAAVGRGETAGGARAIAGIKAPRVVTPPTRPFSHDDGRPRSASSTGIPPFGGGSKTAASGGGGTGGGSSSSGNPAAAAAATGAVRELVVDVVVVGSGAGGGCAAGALAAQGLKVAVLEKGGLYDVADFAGFSEMEAYKAMYEKQGVITTDDAGVVILAGSCVGGGTTVNWTASFRTPRHVRVEWARKHGLQSFELDGPFDKALDAICDRLEVNTDFSHRAPFCPAPPPNLRVAQHNSSLWNGATASGLLPRPIPRNAKGCVDCGSCLHGCVSGSKRSTHTTWLRDGIESGNITLLPNTEVDRVLVDGGRATGVMATVSPPRGGEEAKTSLTVLSRAVVVSGGAIHTPAILLRSGLKHPMIGRHLCLHPVLLVGGVFPEDYRDVSKEDNGDGGCSAFRCPPLTPAWKGDSGMVGVGGKWTKPARTPSAGNSRSPAGGSKEEREKGESGGAGGASANRALEPRSPDFGRGVMMGVFVQDWMGLDGGYGAVIETPPMHPGLMGLCLPWNDAISHRLTVGMARETSVFLCIGRDRSSVDNRVVLGPRGDAVIKYTLGKEDGNVLVQARSEMLRLMRRAGASLLIPGHEAAPWFCPSGGRAGDEEMDEYVQAIEDMGVTTNQAGVYSAHQMGSCRLSATPEGGPLRESGETWECDGLFVADASVFPTSLGINPMVTVEAVAYMVAEQVATRLGKENWPAGPGTGSGSSSPLRRRLKSFSKAVIMAMSPYTHSYANMTNASMPVTDDEMDNSLGHTSAEGTSREMGAGRGRTPTRGRWVGKGAGKAMCGASDDYGVDLSTLAW